MERKAVVNYQSPFFLSVYLYGNKVCDEIIVQTHVPIGATVSEEKVRIIAAGAVPAF